MRSMTGEGGIASLTSQDKHNSKRPHPTRFAGHLLPPVREKGAHVLLNRKSHVQHLRVAALASVEK